MPTNIAKLIFWGVRGSIPTLDRQTWRYGGNTPCLELIATDGMRLVLDCGTGMRALGNHWLESAGEHPIEAHVLVTHYHWDHIQGIPFFMPLYSAQNRFHLYSFQSKFLGPKSLQQVMEAQMANPYFPVDVSLMAAHREFHEITGGDQIVMGATQVTARWLNHPQGCLGFRLETPAGTIVYSTDNEPGQPELDESLRRLAEGADVFINDAQYSPEQLATTRRGWGHSTWLEGVKISREVGAKNLILFHHDPDSSDKVVDGLLHAARQEFKSTWAATEQMVITLADGRVDVNARETRTGQRRRAAFPAVIHGVTEEGKHFEEQALVRDISLHGAFLYLKHRPALQSELDVHIEAPADEEHPLGPISLRGTVVRRESGPKREELGVGILFIEDAGRRGPRG